MIPFKSFKRRKNDRQYLWEYMRRNRIFKVEDILLIVDKMGKASMQKFFKELENAGYIKKRVEAKCFEHRSYALVKNTGVLCPVYVSKQKRLYDRNDKTLQKKHQLIKVLKTDKKRSKKQLFSPLEYAKGRICKILNTSSIPMNTKEVEERTGLTQEMFNVTIEEMEKNNTIAFEGNFMKQITKETR